MAKDEGGGGTSAEGAKTGADAYEQRFMAGAGPVLHRERTVWRLHWLLLFAPIATLAAAVMGFLGLGSKPMPISMAAVMAVMSPLFLLMWANFLALRTVVTAREVMVQFGLFGPRIPLDGIDACEVRDYPALAFGGGIKWLDGAWAYTLFGQGTRAVRIDWHDARGKNHATIVSSPDPDVLAAAILRAQAAAATGGARIAAAVDPAGATPEPVEEEEAAGEEQRARRAR